MSCCVVVDVVDVVVVDVAVVDVVVVVVCLEVFEFKNDFLKLIDVISEFRKVEFV